MIGANIPTGGHLPLEYVTNMVSAISAMNESCIPLGAKSEMKIRTLKTKKNYFETNL